MATLLTNIVKNRIFMILLGWFVIWIWGFAVRLEHHYEGLGVDYKEETDKLLDCSKNRFSSIAFSQECRKASLFLSKPRWIRSITLTFAESGICGSADCISYLFGTEMTILNRSIQLTVLLLIIYLIYRFSALLNSQYKKGNVKYKGFVLPPQLHSTPYVTETSEKQRQWPQTKDQTVIMLQSEDKYHNL